LEVLIIGEPTPLLRELNSFAALAARGERPRETKPVHNQSCPTAQAGIFFNEATTCGMK